jgi:hypothetical protein
MAHEAGLLSLIKKCCFLLALLSSSLVSCHHPTHQGTGIFTAFERQPERSRLVAVVTSFPVVWTDHSRHPASAAHTSRIRVE